MSRKQNLSDMLTKLIIISLLLEQKWRQYESQYRHILPNYLLITWQITPPPKKKQEQQQNNTQQQQKTEQLLY